MSYSQFFAPVLSPGETARLITASGTYNVECLASGALPEYTMNFGSLTAGVWNTDNEDTGLELNSRELAQFRMRIMDDVQLRFNNLAPTRQWVTKTRNYILGQFPQEAGEDYLKEFLFAASEFFVYGDDTPRFDFYSEIATTMCRIKFSGWRFRCREIGARGKKVFWISGWPTGSAR